MQIGTFRRNLMKTVGIKQTKLALREVSRNRNRASLSKVAADLKGNTSNVLRAMQHGILGLPLTPQMKEAGSLALADVGSDLLILAKILKVKTPSPTKKIKLMGTVWASLLALDAYALDIYGLAIGGGLFGAPTMTSVKKQVVIPNQKDDKGNPKKEERDVLVVDTKAEIAAQQERENKIKSILSLAIDSYWRIVFTLLQTTPSTLFDAKMTRLAAENPDIKFDEDKPKAAKTSEAPQPSKAAEPQPAAVA